MYSGINDDEDLFSKYEQALKKIYMTVFILTIPFGRRRRLKSRLFPMKPFSALSKQGRDEIWDFIESMVLQQEEAE